MIMMQYNDNNDKYNDDTHDSTDEIYDLDVRYLR
jgi:hypothetical protein